MFTENENPAETAESGLEFLAHENRRLKSELTQLKSADQFVREREKVLQIILDSATDVIVTIDQRSEIVHINAAVYQVFGYKSAELIGQPVTTLMPDAARERHHAGISCFLRTGKQQSWQGLRFNGLHRDGHEFPIEMSFGAMQRPDGTYRFTGIIRDVTALVEAEDSKRRQLGELAHRQRLLSVGEMASGLAHELNQPLLAICLQADAAAAMLGPVLQQDAASSSESTVREVDESLVWELKTSLSEIANQAERASRVIRSVRSLVRREETSRTSVSLAKIVADVLPICEHCCEQGGAQLVVNVPQSLPDVLAEETLIGQVIANLVQNAVTAMNQISPSSRRVGVSAEELAEGFLQVTISDSGEGFSQEAASRLFESFYTTRSDGLGLGLAICRSIVEAHGGHIRADNAGDGGATFTFTLPVSCTV
ncbi:MAG: PAS domain S-box protein [Rhodopirellula sp.]|nr:PAS domain S-box protein [Rhodopirellula sp.]